jgi:hypothetical protein
MTNLLRILVSVTHIYYYKIIKYKITKFLDNTMSLAENEGPNSDAIKRKYSLLGIYMYLLLFYI